MSMTKEPPVNADGRRSRSLWLFVALVIAAAALALGLVLGRRWAGLAEGTLVRSTPSVVVAVRDLARLEGAEFRIERVISLTDKQNRLFGLVQAEDAILLVASGAVVAGTDLSGLTDADVAVDAARHSVRITLPPSQILSARLDEDHTFVYRRDTEFLAQRKETLETRARQEAERTLAAAASEGGIVERSNESVRRTVESLMRSLGFTQIDVTFRGAPSELRGAPSELRGAPSELRGAPSDANGR